MLRIEELKNTWIISPGGDSSGGVSILKYSTLGDNLDFEDREACKAVLSDIRCAEAEIKALQTTFEKALFEFTETVDDLETAPTKEEEGKILEYINNAQNTISDAVALLNIITGLHRQLENWTARSTQLKDQRKLHDQLSTITAQLRSTLKEKVSLAPTETWTLMKLMTTLDNVIKQEEEIEKHMPKKLENTQQPLPVKPQIQAIRLPFASTAIAETTGPQHVVK
ncbi:hypothetical protein COOONC_00190 [Cooperia oncophora]